MATEVTLEMLQALAQRGLTEQAAIRRENGDMRTLLLAVVDQGRRLERRMAELERRFAEQKDDIELMLKAELMGRLGNFETRIEARIDALSEPKS